MDCKFIKTYDQIQFELEDTRMVDIWFIHPENDNLLVNVGDSDNTCECELMEDGKDCDCEPTYLENYHIDKIEKDFESLQDFIDQCNIGEEPYSFRDSGGLCTGSWKDAVDFGLPTSRITND